ncbi:MAG: cell division protein ZapA [Gammaproteobacteria bacterium]|nr:MAG: cell division protein ZapA [Gammaproteobacteria bacterium]
MAETSTLTVSIMDREFRVNCPESEQQHLRDSAASLDERMREIRETGRVIGVDRIAIMAALNLASELLSTEGTSDEVADTINQSISRMQSKIEQSLNETEELDF